MPRAPMASVSVKRAPKPSATGKRSMHIEEADNGFTSETRNEMSGPNGEYCPDQTTKCVHPNAKHLAKHVMTTFGGGDMEGKKDTAKHEKTESKSEKAAEGDD